MKRKKPGAIQNQRNTEQKNGKGDKETTKRHVYIEPGAQIDLVHDLKEAYKTNNADASTHNRKQLLWTKISAGLIFIYAGFSFWQACESHRAVETAQNANKLTEDSVRGRMVITDFHFKHPVTIGESVEVEFPMKNIGHSEVEYGFASDAKRWKEMPDGDIPLSVQDVSIPLEPEVPVVETTIDPEPITQEFMDSIPSVTDLVKVQPQGKATLRAPHTQTIYIIGKLVYDTIGKRREKDFCFYIAKADDLSRATAGPATTGDTRYLFLTCPKWNTSSED